ncbi:hypothetical protein [Paracholeplasma manati]|uniref:Uncharacterized protein n=1 Tax=Paracholeplasma manati TaxID=591373 RepID=A0ABT2Y678_9MOLU|nr:hypothetical protein [Paracholeplasma manati]MCV2232235.1 hypothetical protein [Paracholeplasma manati]MDG0888192.1 hypothetical protein [Paracholeplasma manati]
MKTFLKLLIGLSILSYLNVLFLNYQIHTDGLDTIHPFWIFTMIVPVILTLFGFSESFRDLKRYTLIDFLLKISILFVVLRASALDAQGYILFNLITIPLFVADILVEWFMYKDYEKLLELTKEPDASYIDLIEETQKHPEKSAIIQEKYLKAIHYSRTLVQIIIATTFQLFGIISVLAILKYHHLVAGILLGLSAIAALLISAFTFRHVFNLHHKIKSHIPKKRFIWNFVSLGLLSLSIGVLVAIIDVFDLSLDYYLILPLLYVFAMPIVISNNHFAKLWMDETKVLLNQDQE